MAATRSRPETPARQSARAAFARHLQIRNRRARGAVRHRDFQRSQRAHYDPNLAKIAANANAGLILNHMRGTPENWAKLPRCRIRWHDRADLDATINRARMAAWTDTHRRRSGSRLRQAEGTECDILAHLHKLAALDYPILVGPSRKHFLAQASENDTLYATARGDGGHTEWRLHRART